MVEVLTHELLNDDAVAHGFFTRHGGVSSGIYSSLNCGIGSKDERENVLENRRRVAGHFGAEALLTLNQIHSHICVVIDKPYENRPDADALVTQTPGLLIGAMSADCGSVLFSGKGRDGRPIIGAAHAGWGGALKGILESTVLKMQELGVDMATLKAVVGPCIGPKTYQVSDSFRDPFINQDMKNARFFVPSERPGHLMFDLPGYCQRRLILAGVAEVKVMGRDTCAEERDFFSYRRSTHKNEPDYGRQVSAIIIK